MALERGEPAGGRPGRARDRAAHGERVAAALVTATMAGSARLIEAAGHDTLAVRRGVTSPGGSTARGLAALEHHGVRAAFDDAMEAVLTR